MCLNIFSEFCSYENCGTVSIYLPPICDSCENNDATFLWANPLRQSSVTSILWDPCEFIKEAANQPPEGTAERKVHQLLSQELPSQLCYPLFKASQASVVLSSPGSPRDQELLQWLLKTRFPPPPPSPLFFPLSGWESLSSHALSYMSPKSPTAKLLIQPQTHTR